MNFFECNLKVARLCNQTSVDAHYQDIEGG